MANQIGKTQELRDELMRTKQQLAEAEKVIEFYASTNDVSYCQTGDNDIDDPEVGSFINWNDFENIWDENHLGNYHGKKAREYLAKKGNNG